MFGKCYNPDKDVPDLNGKTIIVTGGNNGIGKATVEELVKHGAKVYMASRTESKAASAINEIKAKIPSAEIEYLNMDLASFASVKRAADEFNAKEPQLHVLLNNAGVMGLPPDLTKDGYEMQWGTNHMGTALFTKLLLPTLLKTAKTTPPGTVRIVNLSSELIMAAPKEGINFDDTALKNFSVWTRYGQSKLANALHARALAKRYGAQGITAVSIHPGVVHTDLMQTYLGNGVLGKMAQLPFKMFLTDVRTGSFNSIAACTSPDLAPADNGSYFVPVLKKKAGSKAAQDEALADKLWEYTEAELAQKGY